MVVGWWWAMVMGRPCACGTGKVTKQLGFCKALCKAGVEVWRYALGGGWGRGGEVMPSTCLPHCIRPLCRLLRSNRAGDFWQRATLPLTTLLQQNNLTAGDLSAVELLGGGSRVPRLKAALSEVLGGRGLDM